MEVGLVGLVQHFAERDADTQAGWFETVHV